MPPDNPSPLAAANSEQSTYDLVVIGGGIAGLGLCARAAEEGLSVMLLERGRVGGATTAVTSGLFHGGLRYLPYDVATSYAMCREIKRSLREQPQLLSRQPFLWPIYRGQRYGMGLVEALQDYYDLFQPWRQSRLHVRLSASEALAVEPGLEPSGLLGALAFDEWNVDVTGLVSSLMGTAAASGALLREGERAVGFSRWERTVEAVRSESEGGAVHERRGRVFVNAAGPWAEEVAAIAGAAGVRLCLRKGIHLVVAGPPARVGLIFPDLRGHYIGLYPRAEGFLVGPTDDAYEGPPDRISVSSEEERELRQALARILPGAAQRPARSIVGLRPIFGQRAAAALLSRDYRIVDHAGEGIENLLTLTGGKLTSYRCMAEEAMEQVLAKLGRAPRRTTAPDQAGFSWSLMETRRRGVSLAASAGLFAYYALRRAVGAGGGRRGLTAFRESYAWPA